MKIKFLTALIAVAVPVTQCYADVHNGVSFEGLLKDNANLPAIRIYQAEQSIADGNYDKAVEHYIQAIKVGQTDAVYNISEIMVKGKVKGEALDNAITAISLIASKDPNLSFFLGMYFKDITNQPDESLSFKWFNNALSLGSIQSAPFVANYILEGNRDAKLVYSYDNAASMLKLAADKGGDASAAYKLANILFTTDDGKINQNLPVAFKYFEQAASQNYKDSAYKLGYMLEYGLGAPQNTEKAISLYNQALETDGAADANNRLARIYLYGKDGVDVDKIKGITYLTRAANMGQVDANGKLGTMFLYGSNGTKVDIDEAIRRLDYASSHGYKMASSLLFKIYKNGLYGVKPNQEAANKYKLLETKAKL